MLCALPGGSDLLTGTSRRRRLPTSSAETSPSGRPCAPSTLSALRWKRWPRHRPAHRAGTGGFLPDPAGSGAPGGDPAGPGPDSAGGPAVCRVGRAGFGAAGADRAGQRAAGPAVGAAACGGGAPRLGTGTAAAAPGIRRTGSACTAGSACRPAQGPSGCQPAVRSAAAVPPVVGRAGSHCENDPMLFSFLRGGQAYTTAAGCSLNAAMHSATISTTTSRWASRSRNTSTRSPG